MTDLLATMRVSAAGLSAQRTRLDAATSNLANAESTRTADGGRYQRRDVVLQAGPFDSALDAAASTVAATTILSEEAGRQSYLPGHPDADARGMVTLPAVDPVHETVNLLTAARSYELNSSAFETAKALAQRALDLLR